MQVGASAQDEGGDDGVEARACVVERSQLHLERPPRRYPLQAASPGRICPDDNHPGHGSGRVVLQVDATGSTQLQHPSSRLPQQPPAPIPEQRLVEWGHHPLDRRRIARDGHAPRRYRT